MQVICNLKGGVRLARVLDRKGKVRCPHLALKQGMNTVDREHFVTCCEGANKKWLEAMFERGAMLRDGRPALEIADHFAEADELDPPTRRHERSARDTIDLARTADAEGLSLLEATENADDLEPRSTVLEAIERRRRQFEDDEADAVAAAADKAIDSIT